MASIYNRGTKDRPNWYIRYRDIDGKWKGGPSGQPTKELARRYAAEVAARVKRNHIGIPEMEPARKVESLTVRKLVERFLSEYHGPKVRDLDRYRAHRRSCCVSRIFPYPLAELPAQKVRPLDVERWRDGLRMKGYEHGTINATQRLLSVAYGWAIRQEIIEAPNPCAAAQKLPTQPCEERYTLDEVHRMLALPDFSTMAATALYTGMRRGELAGLRWHDIDYRAGRIEVRHSYTGPTKSGKSRTIPIHHELVPILRAWQTRCPLTDDGVVFPVRTTGPWRAVKGSDAKLNDELRGQLQRAGCRTDFKQPWHAFRHTFASLFCEQGGAQAALERILGHSTSGNQVTAGYVHVDVPFLARELGRMSLSPPFPAQIIPLRAQA